MYNIPLSFNPSLLYFLLNMVEKCAAIYLVREVVTEFINTPVVVK